MGNKLLLKKEEQSFLTALSDLEKNLYGKAFTTEEITIVSKKTPTTSPTDYPSGISTFRESQTTSNGKIWLEALNWSLSDKFTLLIQTYVSEFISIQRIHLTGDKKEIIATFERETSGDNTWGTFLPVNLYNSSRQLLLPAMSWHHPPALYKDGFSFFAETYQTAIGKEWFYQLELSPNPEIRLLIETKKATMITVQTIKEIHTTSEKAEIIKMYQRSAYRDNSWGPLQQIQHLPTQSTLASDTELYQTNRIIRGHYYNFATGDLILSNTVSSLGPVPVLGGGIYEKNFAGQVTFFDENLQFLSGENIQSVPACFTIPKNGTKYMYLSHNSREKTPSVKYLGGPIHPKLTEEYLTDISDLPSQQPTLPFANGINSQIFLKIPTPYNDGTDWTGRENQATHPSCVSFPSDWHGYRYWMGFTPYTFGLLKTENPCIVASHDGISWEVPAGVTNPLESAPDSGYHSDTHLFYNEATDTLELWYRAVLEKKQEVLKRVVSKDGSNWSTPEVMLTSESTSKNILQYISPSLIFEDEKYKMWVMRDWFIYYLESIDGKNWSNLQPVKVGNFQIHSWHPNVQKKDGLYYLTNCDKFTNGGTGGEIFYHLSKDGIHWSEGFPILSYTANEWDFDGNGVYRSSLLFMDHKIHLYYGMFSHDRRWTIGGCSGRDLQHLKGFPKEILTKQ